MRKGDDSLDYDGSKYNHHLIKKLTNASKKYHLITMKKKSNDNLHHVIKIDNYRNDEKLDNDGYHVVNKNINKKLNKSYSKNDLHFVKNINNSINRTKNEFVYHKIKTNNSNIDHS